MIRTGGDHELLGLHSQQIIFPHDPHHPLVVDRHPPSAQLRRDSPVTVSATMFQCDLLNCRSYFHLFLHRVLLLQRPVEASAAHRHHLAHALDAEAALQRHHFSDLAVDVISPEPLLRWLRAAIFCKAPLKKSTSIVFSASSRLS